MAIMGVSMLECKGITKKFGGLTALSKVDFVINKGEIIGLIGPNGSGKTTLFNIISGFLRPDEGRVYFEGKDITGCKPNKIAQLGIGRTFQIPAPLEEFTVFTNVALGAQYAGKMKNVHEVKDYVFKILDFVGLLKKKDTVAKNLNMVERRFLELARALSIKPKLLLLDEVLAGLNEAEVKEAVQLIKRIRDEWGITIFMVEHVMKAIMSISDRVIVLNYGVKIADGKPTEVASDEAVIQAYLGVPYA
jgi:branched-chain amino acid transport system ATP-binding protein